MQECKTLNFKLGISFFIENTYVYCGGEFYDRALSWLFLQYSVGW